MARTYRSGRSGSGRNAARRGARVPSRGTAARSPRGGPPRRGGGAGPTLAAIVLVLGVLVLVIVLASGRKEKPREGAPSSSPRAASSPGAVPSAPVVPQPPPYPDLAPSVKREAQEVAQKAKELAKEGEALYQEAMAAKRDGDDDTWQEKLEEASHYFYEIQDLWNELIERMPSTDDYDEEQVANHHLGPEGDTVRRALSRLGDIRKQRRR